MTMIPLDHLSLLVGSGREICMDQIRVGQGLLIICCVFYLIWWGVAFHPNHGDSHTSGIDGILLLITAAFGLAGLYFNMLGIVKTPPERGLVSGLVIIVAGIVTYVAICNSCFIIFVINNCFVVSVPC